MRTTRVTIFYAIAMAITAFARFVWPGSDFAESVRNPWTLYLHLLVAAGPALGAATVVFLTRYRSAMSLTGGRPLLATSMIASPALVMGIMGVPNRLGFEEHLLGIHLGIWIACYAVLEEAGWRGYLQAEFRHRNRFVRYAIVGLFWYAWHFSWLAGNSSASELFTIVFVILASIGIGIVADRTRSVLSAASFHVIGNILGLTAEFKIMMPHAQTRIDIVTVCVMIWLVILIFWRRADRRSGILS